MKHRLPDFVVVGTVVLLTAQLAGAGRVWAQDAAIISTQLAGKQRVVLGHAYEIRLVDGARHVLVVSGVSEGRLTGVLPTREKIVLKIEDIGFVTAVSTPEPGPAETGETATPEGPVVPVDTHVRALKAIGQDAATIASTLNDDGYRFTPSQRWTPGRVETYLSSGAADTSAAERAQTLARVGLSRTLIAATLKSEGYPPESTEAWTAARVAQLLKDAPASEPESDPGADPAFDPPEKKFQPLASGETKIRTKKTGLVRVELGDVVLVRHGMQTSSGRITAASSSRLTLERNGTYLTIDGKDIRWIETRKHEPVMPGAPLRGPRVIHGFAAMLGGWSYQHRAFRKVGNATFNLEYQPRLNRWIALAVGLQRVAWDGLDGFDPLFVSTTDYHAGVLLLTSDTWHPGAHVGIGLGLHRLISRFAGEIDDVVLPGLDLRAGVDLPLTRRIEIQAEIQYHAVAPSDHDILDTQNTTPSGFVLHGGPIFRFY